MTGFLITYPGWCALGWTVLILSIYACWWYSDWNKEIKWGEPSLLERSFFRLAVLFIPWSIGMTVVLLLYVENTKG